MAGNTALHPCSIPARPPQSDHPSLARWCASPVQGSNLRSIGFGAVGVAPYCVRHARRMACEAHGVRGAWHARRMACEAHGTGGAW
eukprot:248124-Chlamydomonas_euryale.AAC.2